MRAISIFGVSVMLATATAAKADDAGCTVILCLSNPAGWAAIAECVAPVQRALKDLRKGRFPVCTFSGGAGGSNARVAYVTESTPTTEDPDAVSTIRVLEFTDASGATRQVRF